jgi:D-proline reductase (dithiol) PrdB
VGLIQRVLDQAGLCTISITQVVEITAIVKPSRAIFVAHPFGLTFGAVGDADTQCAVFDALLSAAVDMDAPGIRDTSFTWSHDDLRARQLRKQRH